MASASDIILFVIYSVTVAMYQTRGITALIDMVIAEKV